MVGAVASGGRLQFMKCTVYSVCLCACIMSFNTHNNSETYWYVCSPI